MTRSRRWVALGLLAVAASCLGVAGVEWSWYFLGARAAAEADSNRYVLFGADAGSAFQNVGPFFLYRPGAVIRTATYYGTDEGLVREFEYEFHTNNLGLVQETSVEPGKPSALVLGDSFTEGQGAEPWFERLAPFLRERNHQPINGGLLGTGFEQWILLHDYLISRGIVVKKLIVVLISEDYEREAWNFPPHVLRCLTSYLNCVGGEEFYGMPPDTERQTFLKRLSEQASSRRPLRDWLPATAAAYGGARQLFTQAGQWLAKGSQADAPAEPDRAQRARRVRFFADLYSRDVTFVHLPTRDELGSGLYETGVAARTAIRESGARLFDGFERCGLTVADFHPHDGHPNAAGYLKIADCVREAAKEIM